MAIARQIGVVLAPEIVAMLAQKKQVDPEAYQDYLWGLHFWNKLHAEGQRQAIEYLRRAIAKDPEFASAYALMSNCYALLTTLAFDLDNVTRQLEHLNQARAAADRAIELNEYDADAHVALGTVRWMEWDWSGAEESFRRALAINPNSAFAHKSYSVFLRLMTRFDESVDEIERAVELDPLTPGLHIDRAHAYNFAGQPEKSLELLTRTEELLERFPDSLAQNVIEKQKMWNYMDAGNWEAALKQLDEFDLPVEDYWRGEVYVGMGRKEEGVKLMEGLLVDLAGTYLGAEIATARGDLDRAFVWLEECYNRHDPEMVWIKTLSGAGIREDPRYKDLIRRMNFPD
jgi:tetratricopeptide (TPR) repeat protein